MKYYLKDKYMWRLFIPVVGVVMYLEKYANTINKYTGVYGFMGLILYNASIIIYLAVILNKFK